VAVIAMRLAEIVLQVPNQRVVPVDDVQGTIRPELQINGTEITVFA
jgi:hypothetical protein